MQQLLLDIRPAASPSLDNYIAGPNQELVSHLLEWKTGKTPEKSLYLWGPPGSGKTHLLRALTRQPAALYWNGADEIPDATRLIALDDVEQLSEAPQIKAFTAFNHAITAGTLWIAAGKNAPSGLSVRDDLRTRLGWGLVYRLQPLGDQDMQDALILHARNLGFDLDPAIPAWLLARQRRDLGYLLQVVEALDRYSLQTQRRVTLPLLKSLLN
ncbi:MAG: DnaA regulatory inactivator Hda [Hydrogenophilaceae bacterium]|nr:DnaA regulatory inactivator Hda [Hydrogenophilaceae bacterium]